MSGCKGSCGGCCGKCGGCGSSVVLTAGEISFLQLLGQIPFLPVARRGDSLTPVYLEEGELTPEEASNALRSLEKRGLISIDYDCPLKGGYSEAYDPYLIKGSFALTASGQQVLDILEIQGYE